MTIPNEKDNGGSWWNERYRQGDTGWDRGEPAPAVFEAADFFERGSRVLVPGCGYGHDAAELARGDFAVEGWDISPLAIRGARDRYRSKNLIFREMDLFGRDEQAGSFDAIFEHTFLCAVGPEKYGPAAREYARLLKPGGLLFAILFTNLEEDAPPPWKMEESRVYSVFGSGFEILGTRESDRSFAHRAGEESLWWMRSR